MYAHCLFATFETRSVGMMSHCLCTKVINTISRNFHFCKFETQTKAILCPKYPFK